MTDIGQYSCWRCGGDLQRVPTDATPAVVCAEDDCAWTAYVHEL